MKILVHICGYFIFGLLTACATDNSLQRDLPTLDKIKEFSSSEEVLAYLDLNSKYTQIEESNPSEVKIKKRAQPPSYGGYTSSGDFGGLEGVVVSANVKVEESITNNQEKGVDQGDIVKRLGDYLLILRKGVLYSVSIGSDQYAEMRLITKAPVQSNGENHDSWYDELLVYDDLLLVVGYSNELDASEMVFFKLAEDGSLAFHQRYLIQTGDYYDTENSATRIVDGKLLMVLPRWVEIEWLRESIISGDANTQKVDLFRVNSSVPESIELVSNLNWIRTAQKLDDYNTPVSQVYSCPLDKIKREHLRCEVVNLLGVYGKFYVSPNAVYVWDSNSIRTLDYSRIDPENYAALSRRGSLVKREVEDNASVIYRVAHNNSQVRAVVVQGMPLNQFSFQERDNRFAAITTVLNYDENQFFNDIYGIDFPISKFSTSSTEIKPNEYTAISSQKEASSSNRFLDDKAFISTRIYSDYPNTNTNVSIWNITGGNVEAFDVGFDIQAFHPLDKNMLAMGTDQQGSLVLETWSAVASPRSLQLQKFDNYAPTESRSVGFNSTKYDETTVFGIPIIEHENKQIRQRHYRGGQDQLPMDIVYFNSNLSGVFSPIGQLLGNKNKSKEDACNVSCIDWYGVARPFFINKQIYGLIDFELLKANYNDTEINTLQRLNIQSGKLEYE